MEFTTTARGVPALILNGFKYLVSGKIYWRCAVNRKCEGSVTTEDGVYTTERKCCAHTPSQPSAGSGGQSGQKDVVMQLYRKIWSCRQ